MRDMPYSALVLEDKPADIRAGSPDLALVSIERAAEGLRRLNEAMRAIERAASAAHREAESQDGFRRIDGAEMPRHA